LVCASAKALDQRITKANGGKPLAAREKTVQAREKAVAEREAEAAALLAKAPVCITTRCQRRPLFGGSKRVKLGDIRRYPSRLVFGEQLGCRSPAGLLLKI
jgi:hypothetical protein